MKTLIKRSAAVVTLTLTFMWLEKNSGVGGVVAITAAWWLAYKLVPDEQEKP